MAWFIYQALQAGLGYERALYLPAGEVWDLIAIDQIMRFGAKQKILPKEADFWELMEYK